MAAQGCLLGPWVSGPEMGDPWAPLGRGDPGGHRTDPGESDECETLSLGTANVRT